MSIIISNVPGNASTQFSSLLQDKNLMFVSRKEAGRKLGRALGKYQWQGPLVLAIPPGGVEIGLEVAEYLGVDLSVIVSSPLSLPDDPGTNFGAIAEDGSTYLHVSLVRTLAPELVKVIKGEQLREIQRRAEVLRGGRELPGMSDRIVIVVSDGVVGGETMKAALLLCRKKYPAKIIVAVPVLWKKTKEEIEWMSDEVISLHNPESFQDVAKAYGHGPFFSEDGVLDMPAQWESRRGGESRDAAERGEQNGK
ncbi:MAG TPA: phosphoribosyltransferase family protein [Candidatus Bathyarchaeia archaeon]|nr:phosphoribosyltransferase family protein [Candidatus Bathyarchaeia archaeon]